MIRSSFIVAACLVALLQHTLQQQQGVESLLPSQTQAPTESSQDLQKEAEEQRIQGEVAEIMAIRKQLGGGVAEALGDLSLEMPGKAVQNPDPAAKESPLSLDEQFAKQLAARSREHASNPDQLPHANIPLSTAPMAGPSERQEAVRHAARMLEEAAAMLEEAMEYDHADHVRKSASELWKAARGL